jgi:dihydroorotate dehydrogenase
MALVPYALTRPFLFGLDPEVAHELTIASLSRTQNSAWRWAYASPRVDDPHELAGLHFPNRVGLAAGLDKNAHCIDGLGAMGFGFIEVGTVTPLAQAGNPKPRMFRLPQARALINRLGFNNEGLDAFIANVQKSQLYRTRFVDGHGGSPMLLGLNIGKNAATPIERATDDYLTCLDGVYPFADYVTVNISSPNTKNLRSLQSDAALDALLGAISERREILSQRHGKRRPIFLKIAPDLEADQITLIARTLQRYGCASDGLGEQCLGCHRHQHHPEPRCGQRPGTCRRGGGPVGCTGAGHEQSGDQPAAQRTGSGVSDHRGRRRDERHGCGQQNPRWCRCGADLYRPDLPGAKPGERIRNSDKKHLLAHIGIRLFAIFLSPCAPWADLHWRAIAWLWPTTCCGAGTHRTQPGQKIGVE